MSAVLWLLQIVLALVFLALGLLKVTRSRERLLTVAPWVEDYPEWVVTTIGVLELLGAAGVVLPGVLGVATGSGARGRGGLVVLLVGAVVTHLLRHEQTACDGPAVLLLAALLVAAGRLSAWPLP